ncbi:MAG: hypothetical protein FWC47_04975 [Oscillospiraceae bacterium]|nr:hypothetical protein [Oscillospiraceae bacterium]
MHKDLLGQRFGRLVVIRATDQHAKNRNLIWECRCDCGNVTLVPSGGLTSGQRKSCGCIKREKITQATIKKRYDLTGQRFGRLVVTRLSEKRSKSRGLIWECKCDCGNTTLAEANGLKSGLRVSCGCIQREKFRQLGLSNRKDITGQRFGRLLVIRDTGKRKDESPIWECKCDCGNVVEVRYSHLSSGDTRSCGCLQKEFIAELGKSSYRDVTGQRFGRLLVLRQTGKRAKSGSVIWECICDCGNKIEIPMEALAHKSDIKSCGCLLYEMKVEYGKSIDLDKQFGRIDNTSICIIKSKKVRKDSGTGHRGVGYYKKSQKYYAYIGFKKKLHHLGYFNTLEEAIKARQKAEEEIFEPFVKLYEENMMGDKK